MLLKDVINILIWWSKLPLTELSKIIVINENNMNDKNKMYDYNKILKDFKQILVSNNERAQHKKCEYLDKIMQIFKQFVAKCQKQIDHIIDEKINKLYRNYQKVEHYLSKNSHVNSEHRNLVIAQFLIKPFEKFPFTGHKNQKLFKEQYNLIQKASVLIQQTLTESFKEEEVPTFDNNQFFETIIQHGVGKQSLTKLRLNPQNFAIKPLYQIVPLQQKINSIVKLNSDCVLCVGDQNFIEVWDIAEKYCIKKLYIDVPAPISTLTVAQGNDQCHYLFVGFGDQGPIIMSYRLDTWTAIACNENHTQKITKIVKFTNDYIISGSSDGLLCLHNFKSLKVLLSSPHVSGIQDILIRAPYVYILQKNSTLLQYQHSINPTVQQPNLTFRRSISAGYISLIRYPQSTTNFSGIGCHIYGLSQIQITPKLKLSQLNIINIPEMISDFIVIQSKQTSQYFAVCVFQSMAAIRIYSLMTQQQVYEWGIQQYQGQVGASGGYMPKLDIFYVNHKYVLAIVQEVQFSDSNVVKLYQLQL